MHLIPLYGSFQEWKSSLNIVGKIQAFVGVAENLNAIVIAFRGTQMTSMQNWAEDLYFKQLDVNYPGVTDAMVQIFISKALICCSQIVCPCLNGWDS